MRIVLSPQPETRYVLVPPPPCPSSSPLSRFPRLSLFPRLSKLGPTGPTRGSNELTGVWREGLGFRAPEREGEGWRGREGERERERESHGHLRTIGEACGQKTLVFQTPLDI